MTAIRTLRKGLRDVRDRAARRDRRWQGVAMAGMFNGDHLLLLIKHVGITRAATWSMLERRWPDIALGDIAKAEPSAWLTIKDAAALARRRRGVEPIRVTVPAQMIVSTLREQWDEPMPMIF